MIPYVWQPLQKCLQFSTILEILHAFLLTFYEFSIIYVHKDILKLF